MKFITADLVLFIGIHCSWMVTISCHPVRDDIYDMHNKLEERLERLIEKMKIYFQLSGGNSQKLEHPMENPLTSNHPSHPAVENWMDEIKKTANQYDDPLKDELSFPELTDRSVNHVETLNTMAGQKFPIWQRLKRSLNNDAFHFLGIFLPLTLPMKNNRRDIEYLQSTMGRLMNSTAFTLQSVMGRVNILEGRTYFSHCEEVQATVEKIMRNSTGQLRKGDETIRNQLEMLAHFFIFCDFPLNKPYGEDALTVFHLTALLDAVEAARALIWRGVGKSLKTKSGMTPFHMCAKYNSTGVMQLLLDQHVNVDEPGENGQTALHYTAEYNNLEAARMLLDHGAAIDAQTINGDTPLHLAACYSSVQVLELLLKQGAIVDIRNYTRQQTPLHFASYCAQCWDILVKYKANKNARDDHDNTPKQLWKVNL